MTTGDPEFDAPRHRQTRAAAAWSVHHLGLPELWERLVASIRRRQGQDTEVLIYAAQAGGMKAVPLIEQYRMYRLRRYAPDRGKAVKKLDEITRRLQQGLSIAKWGVEPEGRR